MEKKKFKCDSQAWEKFKENCRRAGSSVDQELQQFIAKFNQAQREETNVDRPNIDSQIRESLGVQEEIEEEEEAFKYVVKNQ